MAPEIPSFQPRPLTPGNVQNEKRGGRGGKALRRRRRPDGTFEDEDQPEDDPDLELEEDSFAAKREDAGLDDFMSGALPWEAEDAAIAAEERAARQAEEEAILLTGEGQADGPAPAAPQGSVPSGQVPGPAVMGQAPASAGQLPTSTGPLPALIGQAPASTGQAPAPTGQPASPGTGGSAWTQIVSAEVVATRQPGAQPAPVAHPPQAAPAEPTAPIPGPSAEADAKPQLPPKPTTPAMPNVKAPSWISPSDDPITPARPASQNPSASQTPAQPAGQAPAQPVGPAPGQPAGRGTGKLTPPSAPGGRGTGGLTPPGALPPRRTTGQLPPLAAAQKPGGAAPYLQGSWEYKVVDGKTGYPVAAVIDLVFLEARLVPVRKQLRTDKEGYARGQGLSPGRYQLTLHAPGYHLQTEVRFLRPDAPDRATYRLQPQ